MKEKFPACVWNETARNIEFRKSAPGGILIFPPCTVFLEDTVPHEVNQRPSPPNPLRRQLIIFYSIGISTYGYKDLLILTDQVNKIRRRTNQKHCLPIQLTESRLTSVNSHSQLDFW